MGLSKATRLVLPLRTGRLRQPLYGVGGFVQGDEDRRANGKSAWDSTWRGKADPAGIAAGPSYLWSTLQWLLHYPSLRIPNR